MSSPYLYLASAISIGAIFGLSPWYKVEIDDPVGIQQFAKFKNGRTYDYIIVGGGTTGNVIASRLSETYAKVLLLEAGGDGTLLTNIPAAMGAIFGSPMDWKYSNEPDGQSCLAMNGGRCSWHRGKAIGGSSAINGMIYVRGDRDDYDYWKRLGNTGWGYDDIFPYFKKSMDQQDLRKLRKRPDLYSNSGPLVVETPSFRVPLAEAFLKAAKQQGYAVKDLNDGDSKGFAHVQMTMDDGQRMSSAKAFLSKEVLRRPNLDVVLNAQVTKILIKDSKAYGVQFARFGKGDKILTAYARNEVIMSAGAIASPQLLMLSGIGPKDTLKYHGIHIKQDLPGVGKNLQSHIGLGEMIFTVKKPVAFNPLRILTNPANILNYFINGKGPLATPSGLDSFGNIRTSLAQENTSWPDINMNFVGVHINIDGGVFYKRGVNMKDSYHRHFSSLKFKEGFSVIPILLHPYSRGFITLKNTNPFSKPLIHAGFFSDKRDVKVLIEGIKKTLALITQSKAYKKFGTKFFSKPNPACFPRFAAFSDDYWECLARHFTYIIWHDIGTCKMGSKSDSEAVVDSRLKVFGIQGLRVADASIMPTLVSGNTQATCYMIGEKASDMILEDRYFKSLSNRK